MTNSSPVDNNATLARGYTRTVRALMLASTPAPAAFNTVPLANTASPARTSSATGRTAVPLSTLRRTVTWSPTVSQSSTITTASAPVGIGAPVMMRRACPASTCHSVPSPAANVPMTRKVVGAAATSADRTAKPSTAVFANGGTFSLATTSAANTRPAAASHDTSRGSRRVTPDHTCSCAAARVITLTTVSARL